MSIEAIAWTLNSAPVEDASALLVLLGLANHVGRDGKGAFPSRETLAKYARCSVRTVAVKLKALEEAGVISRGDQALVSHYRGDRRPVVYDLQYDVQILHPVGSGYEADGVKPTVERGEAHGNNDVQASAHKPYLEPSNNQESVVSTSPERTPIEFEPPAKVAFTRADALITQYHPDVKWRPSFQAFEQSITLYPEADPVRTAVEYVRKNRATKGYVPTDEKWLSWCAQADKQVKDKQRELETRLAEAKKPAPEQWYHNASME